MCSARVQIATIIELVNKISKMPTTPEYQELIDYLNREGHSDAEIEKILARVRQYEVEMQQDSIMDAIGDGSIDLEALIKESLQS